MAKFSKIVAVPLSDTLEDWKFNFSREAKVENYVDNAMQATLANVGQKSPGKGLRGPDGKVRVMVGNRRRHNIEVLATAGVEDPRTCRRDDKGEIIRGTGKPFSTMEMEVYENLTPVEIAEIMVDNDESLGLTLAEVQLQMEHGFDIYSGNERKTAILCYHGIVKHYNRERSEFKPVREDDGKSFLSAKKGVIDTAKDIWRAPEPLHELCMNKLRTGKHGGWPTNKEIGEGVKIHLREEAEGQGMVTKEAPGPQFLAWCDRLIDAHTGPDVKGNKPKSISAMNTDQMKTVATQAASPLLKLTIAYLVREARVEESCLPILDRLLTEAFKAFTMEQVALYKSCWKPTPVAAPVEQELQVA